EIEYATQVLDWEADKQRSQNADSISAYSLRYQGGLIRQIANSEVLDRCIELLNELADAMEDRGFDPASDSGVLKQLYGEPSEDKWQRTLFHSYLEWHATATCSDKERRQNGYAVPEDCKKEFLSNLAAETKRLEHYREARSSVEVE